MGYIYQIRNILNDKRYIGMTKRSVETRKLDHMKSYKNNNSRSYGFKIYRAMRKYGFDKFEFSTIEECDNSELEKREKYYIELYDTIANGYNETLGGSGKPLWTDKQMEACKVLYENGWLLKDISDVFKSNPKTVGRKLRENYNIDTKENSVRKSSKPIIGVNKNKESIEFLSISEAARYLSKNNLTQNKDMFSIMDKIEISLHDNGKTAYGFKWKYKVA